MLIPKRSNRVTTECLDYQLPEDRGMRVFRNATRASMRLIIQDIYSQHAVRLKTVEIYCDFCCEDIVFSKACFDNFFV
jgi:hypothetical protein